LKKIYFRADASATIGYRPFIPTFAFADMLKDIAVVEKAPKVEGRSMTMFLAQKH